MRTGTATALIVAIFALAFASGYGTAPTPLATAPASRTLPTDSPFFTDDAPGLILREPD